MRDLPLYEQVYQGTSGDFLQRVDQSRYCVENTQTTETRKAYAIQKLFFIQVNKKAGSFVLIYQNRRQLSGARTADLLRRWRRLRQFQSGSDSGSDRDRASGSASDRCIAISAVLWARDGARRPAATRMVFGKGCPGSDGGGKQDC